MLTGSAHLLGNPDWTDNWTLGHDALHGEVLDTSSGQVWLAQAPMTVEQFSGLTLPEGFVPTGIGQSVAAAAYFRRSPGAAEDGPVDTMQIDGFRFARVARPGPPDSPLPGLFVLPVHKHHRVLYAGGSTIEVMDCGDGADYVPLVRHAVMAGRRSPSSRPRVLPDSWSVRRVTLSQDIVVELPCPTRVTFFASGDSFQGPVQLGF